MRLRSLEFLGLVCALALGAGAQEKESARFPHQGSLFVSQISANGEIIAAGTSSGAMFWERASGKLLRSIPMDQARPITALQLSRDGKRLAVGYDDGRIEIQDTVSGSIQHQIRAEAAIAVLTFSPDESGIGYATTKSDFGVWPLQSSDLRPLGSTDFGEVEGLRFSPDGALLVVASDDPYIYVHEVATGKRAAKLEVSDLATFTLRFSPDGKWLYAAGAGMEVVAVATNDWKTTTHLPHQTATIQAIALSSDGKRLAALEGDPNGSHNPAPLVVWDISARAPKELMRGTVQGGSSLAFTPEGELLYTRQAEGAVLLFSFR